MTISLAGQSSGSSNSSNMLPIPEKKPAQPAQETSTSTKAFRPSTEKDYYAYRSQLRDACTKGVIDQNTQLVALRSVGRNGINADGSFKCQVVLPANNGLQALPPTDSTGTCNIDLRVEVVKRDFAPAIRLVAKLRINEAENHQFLLDFNFDGIKEVRGSGCSNLRVSTHSNFYEFTFTSCGATTAGFKLLQDEKVKSQVQSSMDKNFIKALRLLRAPITSRTITLRIPFNQGVGGDESSVALAKMISHLPGGKSYLPKAFKTSAWHMYANEKGTIDLRVKHIISRFDLLRAGHPMQAIPAENTFTSVDEMKVKLGYGVYLDFKESVESLRLVCENRHEMQIWDVGGFAVAAIKFTSYQTLTGDGRLKLPENTDFLLKFATSGRSEVAIVGTVWESTFTIPIADVTLFIDAAKPSSFGEVQYDQSYQGMHPVAMSISDGSRKFRLQHGTVPVKMEPRENDSLLVRQLETLQRVAWSTMWRKVALNQHHTLPARNTIANVPDVHVAKAWDRVKNMNGQTWNSEQLEVFDRIEKLVGGVLLVHGPAGTGKTTVEVGLAVYLYLCGFHVGVVAPSNSAVDVFLSALLEAYPEVINQDIEVIRVYPTSREGLGTARNVQRNESGDDSIVTAATGVSNIDLIRYIMDEAASETGQVFSARDYSLQRRVLQKAVSAKHTLYRYFLDDEKKECATDEPPVNMYGALRDYVQRAKNVPIGDWEPEDWLHCKTAFDYCTADVLSKARLICATSASFVDRVVRDNWADPASTKGVVILSDEATMDLEPNAWSALVRGRWAEKVVGWFLLGDHKQLKPIVTSSKGKAQFNEFREQLELSVFARFMNEGCSSVALTVQNRMHPCIVEFPNQRSYDGKLRSGSRVQGQLPAVTKGVFETVLRRRGLTDEQARLAYITIDGRKRVSKLTGSSANLETLETVLQMLPSLVAMYGDQTSSRLLIITPYRRQVLLYKQRFAALVRSGQFLETELPRVLTIDSSQGKESFHVIIDLVVSSARFPSNMGFIADETRFNVAITRAQHVLWLVGGSLQGHTGHYSEVAVLAYKHMLENANKVHKWRAPIIAAKDIPVDLKHPNDVLV